jgi:hypothetical protein
MKASRSFAIPSIFIFAITAFAFFQTPQPVDNVNSRLDLVSSIISGRGTIIDRYASNTIDKSYYRGHYYSDKAPGASIAALPIAAVFRFFGEPSPDNLIFRWLATFAVVSIPAAFAIALSAMLLSRICMSSRDVILCCVGLAVGTVFLPYSTLFYGHVPGAAMSLALFYIAIDRERMSGARLLFAGFISGWMAVTEYPLAIHAVILLIYIFVRLKNKKSAIALIPGVVVSLLFLGYYNFVSFGNVTALGYMNESHRLFSEALSKGFIGITQPTLTNLYLIALKPGRGLFYQSPFLLFSFYGFLIGMKDKNWRGAVVVSVLIIAFGFALNSAWPFPEGGMASGPRHLIPVLPYMIFLCAFPFAESGECRRGIFAGLVLVSSILIAAVNATNPQPPIGISAPAVEFAFPLLKNGCARPMFFETHVMISGFNSFAVYSFVLLAMLSFAWRRSSEKGKAEYGRVFKYFCLSAIVLSALMQIWILIPVAGRSTAGKHYLLGRNYREIGRSDLAENELEAAVALNPRHAQALFGLGMLDYESGNPAAALSHFRESVSAAPEFPEARFNLASMLMAAGRTDEAFQNFSVILENDGVEDGSMVSKTYAAMGSIREKENRISEAKEYFIKAIEYNHGNARAQRELKKLTVAEKNGRRNISK